VSACTPEIAVSSQPGCTRASCATTVNQSGGISLWEDTFLDQPWSNEFGALHSYAKATSISVQMTLGIEDLLELLRLPMLRVALRIEDYLELLRLPTLRVAYKISRNVQEALMDRRWISDIQGSLSVGVIAEFLTLWDALRSVELQPEKGDTHIFRLANSGKYSAKAAYESLFLGSTQFEPCERIWHSWPPTKCKFFMWLVAHKRCWTADRLQKRGLPHPTVSLFVIKNLKILITCWWGVFFLDNSGTDGLGRSIYRASLCDRSTMDWLKKASVSCRALLRKGSIPLSSWVLDTLEPQEQLRFLDAHS
jgi:hypothetical protein